MILRDLSPLQRETLIAWILEACDISQARGGYVPSKGILKIKNRIAKMEFIKLLTKCLPHKYFAIICSDLKFASYSLI